MKSKEDDLYVIGVSANTRYSELQIELDFNQVETLHQQLTEIIRDKNFMSIKELSPTQENFRRLIHSGDYSQDEYIYRFHQVRNEDGISIDEIFSLEEQFHREREIGVLFYPPAPLTQEDIKNGFYFE